VGISEISTEGKSDGMLDDVGCPKILDTSSSVGDSESDLVGCVDEAIEGIEDGMSDGGRDGLEEASNMLLS
jgi:hypothetical protein